MTLHTDTEGATIWYTTDGTCPCDENGTRQQYTAPIPVTGNVIIRAYAVKGDAVSRVVSFKFGVYDPVGIDSVVAGTDTPDTYYSPSGMRLNRPQKGVNIVRRKGSAIEKVVIK